MTSETLAGRSPAEIAAFVDAMGLAFAAHKPAAISDVLEDLRALTAGREALRRSTYSDSCIARVLDHVEQLHATIRLVAELSAVDGFRFALNQYQISQAVHKQLAAFDPPKG